MTAGTTNEPRASVREVADVAGRLVAAQKGAPRVQSTISDRDITVETGYAIQQNVMRLRRRAGEKLVGYKIGLTSVASQELFSASQPISGYLWGQSVLGETARISLAGMHAPLVEVEVAFVMRSALEGPRTTPEEILAATEKIVVVLEIVDSRWSGGAPGLGQIVADNSNAAAVVVGPRISSLDQDLSAIRADVSVGAQRLSGTGANVMGSPLHAVSWLVAQLSRQNERIEAGQIILSGTMTAPTPVRPGDQVSVNVGNLDTMVVSLLD